MSKTPNRILKIAIWAALILAGIALVIHIGKIGSYVGGVVTNLPPASSNVRSARIHKYFKLEESVLNGISAPEDYAMLAIWAERQAPLSDLTDHSIYHDIFFWCVGKLGDMKHNPRAALALWKIREAVSRAGYYDGHIAEQIEEAEDEQKSNAPRQ